MNTVRTTVGLLRQFTADEPELGVSELARRMGLDKATVHRVLKTLIAERFVEQNAETKRYRLGFGVLDVAAARLASFEFLAVAATQIRQLGVEVGETVSLHVPDGHETVCIDAAEAPHPVRVTYFIGERFPAHLTSPGLAMLSTLPKQQWIALFERSRQRYGSRDVVQSELSEVLARTKAQGYAVADGSFQEGVRAIAAPVCDSTGAFVCALSIAVPAQRLTMKQLVQLAPALKQAAARVAAMARRPRGMPLESLTG